MTTTYRQKPHPGNQRRVAQKSKPQPVIQETPLSSKKGFYILLALLGGLVLFVFHDFLLLNKVFLYKDIGSDSLNGWYPEFYHFSDYLHNLDGFSRWSFYVGMGQNITGLLWGDPFTWLLCSASPDNIAYLVGFIEALKFLTAGLLFYLFLRELKLVPYTAMIGAMCFTFSGFMVLGSCWYLHTIEIYQIAFLFFSVEKLLHKQWYYFPFAIALTGMVWPFDWAMFSLFTGIYVLVRLYNQYGWNVKKMLPVYGQLVGLGALGVGISAFISFEKGVMMLNSPRVSGEVSFFSQLMSAPVFQTDGLLDNLTKIGRLFSNDMLGTGNYFAGAENYFEAPSLYIGLFTLLLFTQLFPALPKRKKWIFGILFACALLPFIFPFFRYALWLFAGKYYRILAFFFALFLLMYASVALNYICTTRKINYKILFCTFFGLLILLYSPNMMGVPHPYQANLPLFQSGLQSFCLWFLLLYTLLISLLPLKNTVRYVKPVLIGLVFIELAYMANITVNKRDIVSYGEMKGKKGYNDYSIEAVNYLHQLDSTFYRIQKTYGSSLAIHKSLKDPMTQRFYGTTAYMNFNQLNYVQFLSALQIIPPNDEYATRWLEGLTIDRPLLQVFGNVHYNLSKQPLPPQALLLNDSINKIGDVYIYKNKFTLPFGYTYSHYLPRSAFDSLSFKDAALLKAVVTDDADTVNYAALPRLSHPVAQGQYLLEDLAADVDSLRQDTFQMTYFSQNKIQGNITLNKDKLLFFTIPFDKGWKVFDNDAPVTMEQVNIGFSGVFLRAGTHQLELRFESPVFRMGIIVSIISFLLTAALIVWFYFRKRNNGKTDALGEID
ncbi:MAG: YfhO family protein [Prevotellaceae bacterium]|jgi:uncharacterized membrane protein YfhO|nr:YfhO family protein [Prevotellaceae bacterium]